MPFEAVPTTGPLHAVQHIRRMRGGAQAQLLRASDGNYYVTKFQNNPQAIRVLANEYLASSLGRLLGLPIPEVRIIHVSEELIAQTPELSIDMGAWQAPCKPGLQAGSCYAIDPGAGVIFDYLPGSMFHKIDNPLDFHRILAFDKWVGNSDGRQAIFVKPKQNRNYTAMFIDQGYCFNAGEWDFPDSPFRGIFARNAVYEQVQGWTSFEPVLSRIEQIEFKMLKAIADQVPEEWYQHHSDAMSSLIQELYERRLNVRELITAFRHSSRHPFPNWQP